MTITKRLSILALLAALALGGASAWHFTRPTPADTLTDQAEFIMNQYEQDRAPRRALPTPSANSSFESVPKEPKLKSGQKGWGVIRIPAMKLKFPLVEGTDEKRDLSSGVGHYEKSASVGQVGNFALAGHVCCESNGQPFKHLDALEPGDNVFIETNLATYTYTVIPKTKCGESQQIVHMTKVEVIDPVPCSDAKPTSELMTLTTCTTFEQPRPATYRRIVWAKLTEVSVKS